jgi:hypothetical protein
MKNLIKLTAIFSLLLLPLEKIFNNKNYTNMKLKLFLMIFLGSIMFFGCKKWSEPEFKVNDWVPPKQSSQLWTIGKKKANDITNIVWRHELGTPPDSIVHAAAGTTLRYVRAVVVSSDEGGNYYKSMVIQDSTGGVELQLDMAGLYNTYPVGQKIVLIPNGLFIGDYNNLLQVGWVYNKTQVGRINSLYFDNHIIKDGLPSLKNLPQPLTNDMIDFYTNKDINKLVRLENVTFEQLAIGKPFAYNDFNTDWIIKVPLKNGTTQDVTVRTSNFAKFRNLIIEKKDYNLTGILSIYRDTYQLMIRTKDDIEILTPEGIVEFDFTKNPIQEGNWSVYSTYGSTIWGFRNSSVMHLGNQVSGHETIMDDWLISPVITYPDFQNGFLRFEHLLPVLNDNREPYQVYYTTSTSTIFNKSDWKLLGSLNSFPATYEWSNPFPISEIKSTGFRIAFRYFAPDTDINTYNWNIRKVEIRNK